MDAQIKREGPLLKNLGRGNGVVGARAAGIFLFLMWVAVPWPASAAGPGQPVRVLYIGNSLTYANDMPRMVANLAKSAGHPMVFDVYAPGGRTLLQHSRDPQLVDKINQQAWDFVVLQDQSQVPAFNQTQVARDVYPAARSLRQRIKQAHPQSTVVFFGTMARRNGDPDNARDIPALGTYEGMQERLNRSYMSMTQENRALLAPVGYAWEQVRQQNPQIALYGDDTHPNLTGSYLIACVFFATFFQESAQGLPAPAQIGDVTAGYLQAVVDEVVLKNAATWDRR